MYRSSNSAYGAHYRGHSVNTRVSSSALNNKPVGLYNLTNTCYISAVLQILFLILPDSLNQKKGKVSTLFYQLKSTRDTRDYKEFKKEV